MSVLYGAHLCLKCSLGNSNFLEEISSLSLSIVFLYFFALIPEEGFLISPCYSLELCIQMGISFIFSFAFACLLFTAICKASSDSHFAFSHCFFLGMILIPVSCAMSWTSIHSSSVHSCHLFDHFQFSLIHGRNIPGSYAMLLFTASNLASITSPTHNWVLFLLWLLSCILCGVISPLTSSSILGTYQPGEFIFQCPNFLPFHTVHRVLKARILKWFAIPFSSGPHSVWPLHHDTSVLGGPARHVPFSVSQRSGGPVIRLASCLWLWFSVSALWCPLSIPTVLLWFLLPWMSGISSQLLQKSTAVAPYLRPEVAPLGCCPWPWTWSWDHGSGHDGTHLWPRGATPRLRNCS